MTTFLEPVQLYREDRLAGFFYAPDLIHIAAAAAAAIPVGYALTWAMDKAFLRKLVDDRIAGIALGCAIAFLLMMAAATALLCWGVGSNPFRSGPVIVPPIGFAIAFILGLAAVGAIRTVLYGREYEEGEEALVFDADIYDRAQYDEEVLAWDEENRGRNYLRRHWAGHLPLPISYWVNGALLSALILAAVEYLTARIADAGGSLRGLAIVALVYLGFSAILWVWSSVGIWRSAYWHHRRGGTHGWGIAARVALVLSLILTLFRSGDLTLQATELGILARGRDSIGDIARMTVSKDGTRLVVDGNLASGAAARFESLLGSSPSVKEVVLNSPGGRMLEARRIAALIRKRGLDTRVDDHCMSACTSLLLAGRTRTAPESARVGFHQPSFPGFNAYELRDAIEETRAEYLAAGVDERFVQRAMTTPAQGIWVPPADLLVEAGVLTGSDVFVTTGEGPSRRETLGEMRVRRQMQSVAAQINAGGPRRVNGFTTMDRVSVSGTTITEHYRIETDRLDVAGSRAALSRSYGREICSKVETALMVREGGRFVLSYRDARGRPLFDVTVEKCGA
ncbi:MAG TPA: hypothetical protein VF548_05905 [Allosphingosinicella sp.]|jgi:hypothetical protein